MIAVRVCMKVMKELQKRTPVALQLDLDGSETEPVLTDRAGVARFELPPGTGRVLVSGVECSHGRLDGEIIVDLWSITQSGTGSAGMPGGVGRPRTRRRAVGCHSFSARPPDHHARQGTQMTVKKMIRHFRVVRGGERGASRYLHKLFPRGGPQKQGNRLARLLCTEGEH
jgi:tRNA 2-thiouridine synthesizing protein E